MVPTAFSAHLLAALHRAAPSALLALVLPLAAMLISVWAPAASAEPAVLGTDFETIDVAHHCKAVRTPAGVRTLEQLAAHVAIEPMTACTAGTLAPGLSTEALWVQFELRNAAPYRRTVYIEQSIPWIDQQTLWVRYEDGSETYAEAGKLRPFAERPVPAPNYFFPVRLPPQGTAVLTMRASTVGSLSIGLNVHDMARLDARRTFHALFSGVVLGGAALLLMYNLFLYFALRDANYVAYSGYVLSVLLFCGVLYGFNYAYLWPDSPHLNMLVSDASPAIASAFGLIFVRGFFDTARVAPGVDRLLKGLLFLSVAGVALQFSNLAQMVATMLNTLTASVVMVIVLLVAIGAWVRRVSGSGYFLAAWSFSLCGYIAVALFGNGLLPFSYVMYYSVGTGLLVEMAMLSFALAGRIQQLHREREQARAASVEAQIQLTESLSRANEELERSVRQRTAELEEARKEAELLARTDGLTGMNNRRALFDFGRQLHAESGRRGAGYAVIMVDLDHFKRINDEFGHQVGDEALRAAAGVIIQLIRDADVAGRIGGEEFAVLLPGADAGRAHVLADRLKSSFADICLAVNGREVRLSASFGVAQSRATDESVDQVLDRADAALYEAKRGGRNRIVTAAGGGAG